MSNSAGGARLLLSLDDGFARLAVWSTQYRWVVLLLSLCLLAVGLVGASLVRQDNSMEAYFNEGDATYASYKAYVEAFSSDEVTYILYAAPGRDHGPFDLEVMRSVEHLTQALEAEVPFARKVTSLTNVEFIEADGDDIRIDDLLADFPDTQTELLTWRDKALSKPLYVGAILSEDARYGAVIIEMSRTSTDPIERLRLDPDAGDALDNLYPQVPTTVVREILDRPEYQELEFWLSGDAPMNAEYNELLTEQIGFLTLLTIVLVAPVSLFFIRRRWQALLAPIGVVLLSVVLTLGVMGYVGWRINLFFLMIPSLLCAVGVAQAVHVLLAREQALAAGLNGADALVAAVRKVGTPCLLAAVTTAIGFLGMSVSDLRAVHELAYYSAVGVLLAFVLSMSLLLSLVPNTAAAQKRPAGDGRIQRLMSRCAELSIRRPPAIVAVFAVIAVGALIGVSRLHVDFNFLEEFKESNRWRQHTEQINDVMGGLLSVVYVVDAQAPNGTNRPEILHAVEILQNTATEHSVVMDSLSMADIIKELNQAFHGDDPAYYRIPESREALAQLMLVYEISGGEEMDDVLNIDKSKTALQVRLKLVGASRVREFLHSMDDQVARLEAQGIHVQTSGIGLLWVKMADYITSTQIKGYAVVFTLIALVMMLAFGSVKTALIGMIPNLFPIVLVLGLMGWIGWALDYFRLLLATIAIGIAVDDTIHMMTRLRTAFDETGDYDQAIREATRTVGPALLATTVILTVAFLSYLFSAMAILASFGVLLAATIVAALAADLFLLPAIIKLTKPFGPERLAGANA